MKILFYIMIILTIWIFIAIFMVFFNNAKINRLSKKRKKIKKELINKYLQQQPSNFKTNRLAIDEFIQISIHAKMSYRAKHQFIKDFYKYIKKYKTKLNSLSKYQRKKGAYYLGNFNTPEMITALVNRLQKEKNENVKLYLVNSLKMNFKETISEVVNSLCQTSVYYRSRVIEIIKSYYEINFDFIEKLFTRQDIEVIDLLVELASIHKDKRFNNYLLNLLNTLNDKDIYYKVLNTLVRVYGFDIYYKQFRFKSDFEVQKLLIESKTKIQTFDSIKSLWSGCDNSQLDQYRMKAILDIIEKDHDLYFEIIEYYPHINDPCQKKMITTVLAQKTKFLIMRLNTEYRETVIHILQIMIGYGLTKELINFLNHNKDQLLEEILIDNIKQVINPEFANELMDYANDSILKKLNIEKTIKEKSSIAIINERKKIQWLTKILLFSIFTFPILFIIRHNIFTLDRDIFMQYVIDVHIYLILYYIIGNLIYLILLFISYWSSQKQVDLWLIKDKTMLYENKMLPCMAIIAPAYNEELTIIDSVNSLLNIDYPNYEIIVVNDGSRDQTINKLIDYYKLEMRNTYVESSIATKRIKGVYTNKNIPNLIVVDKENGGKADALNCGINVSSKEYLCVIDADSILDRNALLCLMSSTIDYTEKAISIGGYLFPVNNCVIDYGQIDKVHLPKTFLTRFQAIEYIRAFTTARIGWAKLKSLLIVSGAFGVFDRNSLIEVGGYLTSSTIYKKDTLGEDMELVVRLSRYALENKMHFRVDYVYNALCYTEVPADIKSFLNQRNRWHRGMVDILSFHRSIIFNPKYKQVGLISLPYFTIFEMVGPLFELQLYILFVFAFILGWLTPTILLGYFIASILMGVLISVLSLSITEKSSIKLSTKDTFILVIFAIIENFGYRQFMSLYRVKGFVSSLKKSSKWGEMKRIGFKK